MKNNMYEKVSNLAHDMIAMADADNVEGFEQLYKELQLICTQNEAGAGNHPVQWETLADFTQDLEEAIVLYKKALAVAEQLKEHQYSASIHYAIADRYSDMDDKKAAVDHASKAKALAEKLDDDVLKNEIDALLVYLAD